MNPSNIDPRDILLEDNHLIIVNKRPGQIVQGDRTGDEPLSEKLKRYIKQRYGKPGNVFLGTVHRLDRPVSGAVVFARTSKALERMNRMLREHRIRKIYYAVVEGIPEQPQGRLHHFLKKNPRNNKTSVFPYPTAGAKEAVLQYRILARGERYTLLEIVLETGRHHQIRAQLAKIGHPVKGDLKYGARRSLPGGGIMLHARELAFEHPVRKSPVRVIAPFPPGKDWEMIRKFTPEVSGS